MTAHAGPLRQRELTWERLESETFDVCVIGGGINGAAVARDAVLRGMTVALLERCDFACGTSSRSSKLVHGGVRYLQQGDVALVLESCRERDVLRTRIAPHLVRAQRFVFPIYDDDSTPVWQLRIGLTLYDLLAGFQNVARHKHLSVAALREHEPAIASDGLRGGALYYDCWTDDARLTLETALAARGAGAAMLNHAEVVAFEKDSTGRVVAAGVRDRLGSREATVHARSFVNVAGPWLDAVRRLDDGGAPPRLRLTKGVHAIFDRSRIGNRDAVVMRGIDGRVMFAIPWQSQSVIGTTDTFYTGDPAECRAEPDDIDYILAAVNRAFPQANVTARDIISAYAGLRPLVAPEDERTASEVSREDQVFESPAGLLSLGGGKLTTHRKVAELLVDRAAEKIGRRVGPCRTAEVPLPGGAGFPAGEAARDEPQSTAEHIRQRYGSLAGEIDALVRGDGRLGERAVDDRPDLVAELVHAVEFELACSIDDVLSRRVPLALRSRERAGDVVVTVGDVLASRLGWDAERTRAEVASYREYLRREAAAFREGGSREAEESAA
ncbi:MAG TPA: glycerol-3-phosphate dehydrogenase/oxidase [Candidatus Limnocylindrales bacterium]|nr:glycerol-3-phosphate dehydrogenase/oxidase [Candidatus Limnocylindrales bacterium]